MLLLCGTMGASTRSYYWERDGFYPLRHQMGMERALGVLKSFRHPSPLEPKFLEKCTGFVLGPRPGLRNCSGNFPLETNILEISGVNKKNEAVKQ